MTVQDHPASDGDREGLAVKMAVGESQVSCASCRESRWHTSIGEFVVLATAIHHLHAWLC